MQFRAIRLSGNLTTVVRRNVEFDENKCMQLFEVLKLHEFNEKSLLIARKGSFLDEKRIISGQRWQISSKSWSKFGVK